MFTKDNVTIGIEWRFEAVGTWLQRELPWFARVTSKGAWKCLVVARARNCPYLHLDFACV